MSVKRITVKNFSTLRKGKTNWTKLRRLKDEKIAFSDIPELTDEQLARMAWTVPRSGAKVTISMRVDPDVLDWYRALGKGYQSRMHMVLRAFMHARATPGKSRKPARHAA